MSDEAWRMIFDASTASALNGVTLLPLLIAVGSSIGIFVLRRARPAVRLPFLVGVAIAALALVVLTSGLALVDARRAKEAKGGCVVHEGRVKVLRSEPEAGHGPHERIQVGDVVLEFSFFRQGRFYHDTLAHGGVLTNGTMARVCVFRGQMLRVEVR